jgi:hypothetical protein
MDTGALYLRVSQSLSDSDKSKVLRCVAGFSLRARTLPDARSVQLAAVAALRPLFPTVSPPQMDLLAIYLVAKVAVMPLTAPSRSYPPIAITGQELWQGKLDLRNEMNEAESLRLQMSMDRLSKLMSVLSNLQKKLAETQNAITQNIK